MTDAIAESPRTRCRASFGWCHILVSVPADKAKVRYLKCYLSCSTEWLTEAYLSSCEMGKLAGPSYCERRKLRRIISHKSGRPSCNVRCLIPQKATSVLQSQVGGWRAKN